MKSFAIQQILAAGAYGTVCVARDAADPDARLLAIKVLQRDHTDDITITRRARDEARMLSRLHHPNLVEVLPILQVDGWPVVVMEYIEGASLEEVLGHHRCPLPAAEALEIIRRAAIGLHAAFSDPVGPDRAPMHIVHRDVKPSNLLVSVDGELKVVDFGIARAHFTDREAVTASLVLGTLAYAAPERHTPDTDTSAVDVYALGAVLYELLTNRRLVLPRRQDRQEGRLIEALEHLQPPELSDFVVSRLRRLLRRMCAYEADQRPTAAEVAAALAGILADAQAQPDLRDFAARWVLPIVHAREQLSPHEHPRWPDVRFLESTSGASGEERGAHALEVGDPARDDAALAAFLARPGWTTRRDGLEALLRERPGWTARPLLALLRRARRPWWQVWTRAPTADELVAALALAARRPGPDVDTVAQTLHDHPDRSVARAARALTRGRS